MTRTRLAISIAMMLACVSASTRARAQNADPFFYGDEAALSAGSVVASGRDTGALWYNPAGLGGLKRGILNASASTFGIRHRSLPSVLSLRLGSQTRTLDIGVNDIISVPNAVVVASSINERFAFAAGLLMTAREINSTLARAPALASTAADGRTVTSSARLDLSTDIAKYHFGGALGVAVNDELRIGASLFGTYAKLTGSVQYSINVETPPGTDNETAFVTANARTTGTALGLTGALAAQWQPSKEVAFGLTLRAPEVSLAASAEGGGVIGSAHVGGTNAPTASYTDAPPDEAKTGEIIAPARALAGAAFAVGPDGSWLEIGGDAALGLKETTLDDSRRPVWNARIGYRGAVSPEWIIGGGVFTDHALTTTLTSFPTRARVDYYGITLGFSKRTPLALVKNPSPDALVLVTTLSVRYAMGFGEARTVAIALDGPPATDDPREKVMFYEILPYLGSSILF